MAQLTLSPLNPTEQTPTASSPNLDEVTLGIRLAVSAVATRDEGLSLTCHVGWAVPPDMIEAYSMPIEAIGWWVEVPGLRACVTHWNWLPHRVRKSSEYYQPPPGMPASVSPAYEGPTAISWFTQPYRLTTARGALLEGDILVSCGLHNLLSNTVRFDPTNETPPQDLRPSRDATAVDDPSLKIVATRTPTGVVVRGTCALDSKRLEEASLTSWRGCLRVFVVAEGGRQPLSIAPLLPHTLAFDDDTDAARRGAPIAFEALLPAEGLRAFAGRTLFIHASSLSLRSNLITLAPV